MLSFVENFIDLLFFFINFSCTWTCTAWIRTSYARIGVILNLNMISLVVQVLEFCIVLPCLSFKLLQLCKAIHLQKVFLTMSESFCSMIWPCTSRIMICIRIFGHRSIHFQLTLELLMKHLLMHSLLVLLLLRKCFGLVNLRSSWLHYFARTNWSRFSIFCFNICVLWCPFHHHFRLIWQW